MNVTNSHGQFSAVFAQIMGIFRNIYPKMRKKWSISQKTYRPTSMVPLAGLEPARSLERGILSPLRLPIPPHEHIYSVFV